MGVITIAIIGCGYVADFYMETIRVRPDVQVVRAFDIEPAHAARFGNYWKVPTVTEREAFFDGLQADVILNLTNPDSHYPVSRDCIERGFDVWSEKPLAMTVAEIEALRDFAVERGVSLGSAPCNHLGEALDAVRAEIEAGSIGQPILTYAEMDDNFVGKSPYRNWKSVSGAPWPAEDEFEVGCTLEHAGYCLSWLIALFGSVTEVHAFSALIAPGKPTFHKPEAPDYSVTSLRFESGMVARMTCGIIAPRDHVFRVFGEDGELTADDVWYYGTPIAFRRWLKVRRRFMLSPFPVKVKSRKPDIPIPEGSVAQMDFVRGAIEMVQAKREGRPSRVPLDFCVHFNEVSLAIHESRTRTDVYHVRSRCTSVTPVRARGAADPGRLGLFERHLVPLLARI